MKQDMNDTFRIAFRAMFVAAMTLLTGSTATAQVHVNGSVYGGGNLANVGGTVVVNMSAGTVDKDVYGGGALANTNTNNTDDPSVNTTTVNLTGGMINGDAYGGGLGRIAESVHYTQEEADAYNSEHNLSSGDEGFKTTTDWLPEVKATVYGDINVNLGKTDASSATKFNISKYSGDHSGVVKSGRVFGCNNLNGSPQGNVTVTVYTTVKGSHDKTPAGTDGKAPKTVSDDTSYRVAAVYGGGNLANYAPTATGKKTHVVINGCDDTSIEYVYGGGNAADVPETDVDINEAYEIGTVFGGGNGKDQYTLDGTTWNDNAGADVNGNANTILYGGTIHEAFGGSNEKGTISGSVYINTSTCATCPLNVGKIYGAGKNADINGDLIMVLGCKEARTEEVYGGAENANVKGNVELTITSGEFGKVFGGNNQSGAIFGHIKLNIQETSCTPIKIDELYLGGNEAAYSIYGYYVDGTNPITGKPLYKPRSAEMHNTATTDPNYQPAEDNPTVDDDHPFPYDDPELNIISCESIGMVFGGGFGEGAALYGNPTVNINQTYPLEYDETTKAYKVKRKSLGAIGGGYEKNSAHVDGGVFGGGNEATVYGNTTVNIGTETSVNLIVFKYDENGQPVVDGDDIHQTETITGQTFNKVLGANIVGNVYGGGNKADVTGNTFVNICAKKGTGDSYTSVAFTTDQVIIGGNVFGGGKGVGDSFTCEKAMVGIDGAGADADNYPNYSDGNTTIVIGNGTVTGNVYGGGEIGRVEMNTSVTIGLGDGVASGTVTSAPEIQHSVFGGGKGLETHGYSALVRGNPTVIIQGNAKVRDNVYGGGQIASVARYKVAADDDEGAPYGVKKDMPYALLDPDHPSGICTVTVQGYAEIGPATIDSEAETTLVGHVFGAGKGIVPGPGGDYAFVSGTTRRMVLNADKTASIWEIFADEAAYITFIKTLALASQTYVTIDGNAKVKGSVFGGSESGFVQFDTNVNVTGGTIGTQDKGGADFGNVYGGGKGDAVHIGVNVTYVDAGLVKGDTKVKIEGGTILHNIYGGGAYGTVGEFVYDTNGIPTGRRTYTVGTTVHQTTGGNTEVYVTGGEIGTSGSENGMIFGSSRGDVGAPGEIHDKLAWVYDTHVAIGDTATNATITTATPLIKGSVYGGGENGHNFHNSYVRINGGTIGISDETDPYYTVTSDGKSYSGAAYPYRGNVYGGGCGTDKYYSGGIPSGHTANDGMGNEYNSLAGIVQGNAIIHITAGNIVHNVYGAGAMGSVGTMTKDNDDHLVISSGGTTTVSISGGTVGVSGTVGDGNVFGAARGDVETTQTDVALVKTTGVTISQAEGKTTYVWGNVYGGGETGDVGTYYTITEEGANKGTNAYLEGSGACVVEVTGGTVHHNVFGAGKGESSKYECKKAMVSSTDVTIDTNAKVNGNVYGGGEVGRVEYNTVVKIGSGAGAETGGTSKPEIGGSVYGAGAGLETHGYSALVRGNSTVTVEGNAKVNGNVYGGGEKATVGKYWVSLVAQDPNEAPPSGFPDGMPYKTRDGGICTVNIQGYAQVGPDAGGSKNAGNVFGAGKGVEPSYSAGESQRMKNGDAWEKFTAEDKYLEFLQTLALASVSNVTVDGNAKVKGSVYGGSESGFVQDESFVTIKNGEIGTATYGDIYGGGRGLSNFAEAGRVKGGVTIAVDGGTAFGSVYGGGELGIVTGAVLVNINNGIIEKDVYGGGALANTNTNNWNGTTLTETYLEVGGLIAGTSSVAGYYTKSGDNYTILTTGTAVAGTKYYRKVNTTVNLLGGKIYGDAYGGGLGDLAARGTGHSDVAAMVYGDVFVNLGKADAEGKPDLTASATAFNVTLYKDEGHTDVVKSGRVFGCNNLNGSPQGNVTVTVNKTVEGNTPRTAAANLQNTGVAHTYELANVYGGGNLANYTSTTGKVKVIINSCDVSVQEVYGGGNAAAVPATDVLVRGAYEIAQVFGGGNGEDDYYLNGQWNTNPGANVGGNATTLLTGGYIHEAYGASNSKGVISGNINISKGSGGECDLNVVELYGAGKDADVEGDLIMVMGCSETRTEAVYGCARNANVKGNVELTITSGEYGKIFGGNNESGAIFGHIVINIEEDGCSPIIIDELYGCGNDAAYSTYGYYQDGTIAGTDGKPKYVARSANDTTHEAVTFEGKPHTVPPYDDPEVNVISCTSIGKVFGGGYGAGATVYGNPKVNINMIKGAWAGKTYGTGESAVAVPDQLGVIGDVYGGGNEANVEGNTYVNIGTVSKVKLHKSYDTTNGYTMSEEKDVLGANITGNVFGGGKGKDDSFFCEKAMIGKDGDGIDHPEGGTHVTIGNGTVMGNVYGGGEIGRVEKNTVVTIGLAGAGSGESAPVIKGNVFGGGMGKETHGYAALVRGNPTVTIQADAKVEHNVYGGGQIASVARYNVPRTEGEVEDAIAQGYDAHLGMPYALANTTSGNCHVTVKDNAIIGPDTPMKMYHSEITDGSDKPDDAGHVFGAGKGILPENYTYVDKEHKPKRMVLRDETIHTDAKKGIDWEYVDPSDDNNKNVWEYFADRDAYIIFIQTLALSSYANVTIGDDTSKPFVKGSVYGGSENGLVQFDTKVYIKSGQIGCGKNATAPYGDDVWADGYVPTDDLECASWEYGLDSNNDGKKDLFAPYDPNANASGNLDQYPGGISTEGGRRIATDGHTYYGNVFGGGSGSVPYFDTTEGISKYLSSAGTVKGDTYVEISGGHILTNVYGGCEATNVLGTAKVTMTDGTLGVPRTPQQIKDHPVTCYLFGAGKGDQRIYFNKETNVNDAIVNVEGGRIYGSVFGGGEDGHVLRNTTVTIGKTDGTGPKIGTVGSTYVDGNVFGGGRGFGGEALTAGNVGGSVDLIINGGTMLGSVYGGGRLASVGYGLYLVNEEVGGVKPYGKMREDNEYDGSYPDPSPEAASAFYTKGRGHITVNINGGTIGSDVEDEHSGNVFGGSMGRLTKIDGSPFADSDHWSLLATAKTTEVKIAGGTIKRNVYGGGEMGTVTKDATVTISGGTIGKAGSDNVEIGNVFGGGKGYLDPAQTYVGAGIVKGNTNVAIQNGTSGSTTTTPTIYQNVYGGGELGYVGMFTTPDHKEYTWTENTGLCTVGVAGGMITGHVFGAGKGHDDTFECERAMVRTTSVAVSGGTVGGNVYGGGEVGRVDQNSAVTIGPATGDSAPTITGSVFGAGAGVETHGYSALVRGNTAVVVQGNAKVGNSVYGGGQIAAVGRYGLDSSGMPSTLVSGGECVVTVQGNAVIGTNGTGNVFGAGMGVDESKKTYTYADNANRPKRMMTYASGLYTDANKALWEFSDATHTYVWEYFDTKTKYLNFLQTLALATDTRLTINGNASVNGSVYGGSESGFVQRYTDVRILGGEIRTIADASGKITEGNVFGGGKGISDNDAAGRVRSDTRITVLDGTINGDVYGGGALGKANTLSATNTTIVNLLGGTINGDVYGGGLGNATTAADVGNTKVNLNGMTTEELNSFSGDFKTLLTNTLTGLKEFTKKGAVVKGNVFGANNVNGTPKGHVLVHVHGTQNENTTAINAKVDGTYDVSGVFGGGNNADYVPAETESKQSTEVIIEGCDLTSIYEVYGGGYGAASPGTNVLIKGTKIIDNVFGGGYGAGTNNPGANVGYRTGGTTAYGLGNEQTKTAIVQLMAGHVNNVYGGSNTKGDIRGGSSITNVTKQGSRPECCDDLDVGKVYGGGKDAEIDRLGLYA